jgi:hypothetical protein
MNETLESGKYYLGDPSHVLSEKIYIGILENIYQFKNGKLNINGIYIIIHNTHSGDGIFIDTKNRKYSIQSGLIGLIPLELIENTSLCKDGHVFNFENKVNFIYDAGIFYIKSGRKYINIDTRNMDDYDSDYEEHFQNEDGEPISKTLIGDEDNDMIMSDTEICNESDEEEDIKEINEKQETFSFFKKK